MIQARTVFGPTSVKKRTSIGNSRLSRPKNKYKKRCHKPYRGQGK